MSLNLALLRIDYEIFHKTVDEICAEHGVSRAIVDHAIKSQEWKRQDLDTTEAMEVATTDLKEKLDCAHVLRQQVLDPQYIRIEAAITEKTLDVINSIDSQDPNAAVRVLKQTTDILSTLRPTQAMIDTKKQAGEAGLKILIMNKVGDVGGQQEEVSVQVDASMQRLPDGGHALSKQQGVTYNAP